jgi:hypothetical protein
MTDYQKIKYSVTGFIAGIGVLFGLATVLLMPPEEMWRWILNSQSNGAKVEKALSNPSEQLATLEKINQQLRNDLVNEKTLNIEKYQALVDDNLQLKKSASDLQDKLENIENINAQLNKKNEVLKLRNDLVNEDALNIEKYQVLVDDNLRLKENSSDLQDKLENIENINAQLNKKNEVLADKNKELESIVAAPKEKTFHSPSELYTQSSGILKVGSEFVDPATRATLGISKILYGDEAIGYISLPGKKPEYFNNISAGYERSFEKLGKNYVLTLKKTNYLNQNFSVDIREEVN